jgi:hypothetical protein
MAPKPRIKIDLNGFGKGNGGTGNTTVYDESATTNPTVPVLTVDRRALPVTWVGRQILAENSPAETFTDNVDRQRFDNWSEHAARYADGKQLKELPYPRAKSHRQVPVDVRVKLAERARSIGAAFDGISAA